MDLWQQMGQRCNSSESERVMNGVCVGGGEMKLIGQQVI